MQYEISIYDSLLWLPPLVVMLSGLALIIFSRHYWWGFGLIIVGGISLLSLPFILGYWCVNRFDMMDHIGYSIDMAKLDISRANPYPLLHVAPALLINFGLSPHHAVGLMPMISYLVFIASMFFLAYTIWGKSKKTYLATAISTLLIMPFGGEFTSTVLVVAVFPAFLALYLRAVGDYSWHWREVFFLCALITPFIHAELSALMVVVILAGVLLGHVKKSITPLAVIGGMFCLWYWGRAVLGPITPVIAGTAASGSSSSTVANVPPVVVERVSGYTNALQSLNIAGVPWYGVPWLMLKMYGGEIIIGAVALIAAGLLLRRFIRGQRPERAMLLINGLFLGSVLVYALYFFGVAGMDKGSISSVCNRLLYFIPPLAILVATPLLAGLNRYITACLLGAVLILSVFNAYPSTGTYQPNRMVTYNEIEGAAWLLKNKEPQVPVAHLGLPIRRYYVSLNGINSWNEYRVDIEGDGSPFPENRPKIPNHLGYDRHESIGEIFDGPTYLMITSFDRMLYKECWKEPIPARWTDDDFNRLYSDPSARLVYQNPDFEVWEVNFK